MYNIIKMSIDKELSYIKCNESYSVILDQSVSLGTDK